MPPADVPASTGAGRAVTALRADGGGASDLVLRLLADQIGLPVERPVVAETTALGAAYLAGIATDVWESPAALNWQQDAAFTPDPALQTDARDRYRDWHRAVERSRHWASD